MKVRLSKRRKVGLVDIIGLSKIMFRYEFKGLFIKKGVKVRKSIVNNSKRLKGVKFIEVKVRLMDKERYKIYSYKG